MKRREFLAASCLAGTVGAGGLVDAAQKKEPGRQYLELRHYDIANADKRKIFDDFLAGAMIPALNGIGVGPVGVFRMAEDEDFGLWVLMPHKFMGSVMTLNTRILADARYQEAGKSVIECPKDDPVYQRMSSSLLLAFEQCPVVETPAKADTRLFQLRIYESHNTTMAKRKIEMFNKGEIALFRRTGMNPVFFGERIIGDKMPCLTYMLGFDDADAQKKAWDTFRDHAEWKKMSSDPYYKDTVSNITNLVLKPAASSQI
jgi:hypothetical protein